MGSSFVDYTSEMNMTDDQISAFLDAYDTTDDSLLNNMADNNSTGFGANDMALNFHPPATATPSQLSVTAGGALPQMFGQSSAFATPPTFQQIYTAPALPMNFISPFNTPPAPAAAATLTPPPAPQQAAVVTNTALAANPTPPVHLQWHTAATPSQQAKKPKAKRQKKVAVTGPKQTTQLHTFSNMGAGHGLGIMQPRHIGNAAQQVPQGYHASTNPAHAHLLQAHGAQGQLFSPPQMQNFTPPPPPPPPQQFAPFQGQQFGPPQGQHHHFAPPPAQQQFVAPQAGFASGSPPVQQMQTATLQSPPTLMGPVQQSLVVNRNTTQTQLGAPVTKRKRVDSASEHKRREKLFLAPNSTIPVTEDGDLVSPFMGEFLVRIKGADMIHSMECEEARLKWETANAKREKDARLAAAHPLEGDFAGAQNTERDLAAALHQQLSANHYSTGLGLGDDDTLLPGFEEDQGLADDPEEEEIKKKEVAAMIPQELAGMDADDLELFQALSNELTADNNSFDQEADSAAETATTPDDDNDNSSLGGEANDGDTTSLFGDDTPDESPVPPAAFPTIKLALPQLPRPTLALPQLPPIKPTTPTTLPVTPSLPNLSPAPVVSQTQSTARQLPEVGNSLTQEDRDFAAMLDGGTDGLFGMDSFDSNPFNFTSAPVLAAAGFDLGDDDTVQRTAGASDDAEMENIDVEDEYKYDIVDESAQLEQTLVAASQTHHNMGSSGPPGQQALQFAPQQQQQQQQFASPPQQGSSQQQFVSQQLQFNSPPPPPPQQQGIATQQQYYTPQQQPNTALAQQSPSPPQPQQASPPQSSTNTKVPLCPLFLASNGTHCPYGAACQNRHYFSLPPHQSAAIAAQVNYMAANNIPEHDAWQEGLLITSFKRGARFDCKNCGQEKPVSNKNDGIRCTPCFKRWCRGSD